MNTSTNAEAASPRTVSDNDRLIAAVQTCFQDLITKQDELSRKQAEQGEKAVEGLKSQEPVDKPDTAFWKAYDKLANECDKEFQEKYGTDLDTALIFMPPSQAGLFSAVSSAFIIQIQPQLSFKPLDTRVLIAQTMLYISLLTTLLAALLAVLGKQWVMYYQSAGSRGTIEHRVLERQSKLDGLRRWKFEAILQMFPLLLQLALLLFATALSVYLWTVHLSIAIVVLALTSLGISLNSSPRPTTNLQKKSQKIQEKAKNPNFSPLRCFGIGFATALTRLTFFVGRGERKLCCPFRDLEEVWMPTHGPSDPARAILWVLQTSADPALIDCAVEMGIDPDIQWPSEDNIVTPMLILRHDFISCFDWEWEWSRNGQSGYRLRNIRPGMSRRAIQCGKLYCSLRNVARASGTQWTSVPLMPSSSTSAEAGDQAMLDQLLMVIQLATDSPNWGLDWSTPNAIRWALHIIPSLYIRPPNSENTNQYLEHFLDQFPEERQRALDAATFTNYLCCLCSILGHVNQRVMGQVDKMSFQTYLMAQLFQGLQITAMGPALLARVIHLTAKFGSETIGRDSSWNPHARTLLEETFRFCLEFPRINGWLDVIQAACTLARGHSLNAISIKVQDISWIYLALEHLRQSFGDNLCTWEDHPTAMLESLLQLMACMTTTLTETPPLEAVEMILQALQMAGNISLFASLVLWTGCWIQASCQSYSAILYGPAWGMLPSHIPANLNVITSALGLILQTDCIKVLRTIWISDSAEQHNFADTTEESWALAMTALSNVWCKIEFSTMPSHELIRLARCTVSMSFHVTYSTWSSFKGTTIEKTISRKHRRIFSLRLGETLTETAQTATNPVLAWPETQLSGIQQVSRFLEELGHRIRGDFVPGTGEVQIGGEMKRYRDWVELKEHFMAELDRLEDSLSPQNST
ncbi:hypothetical protein B0H14DRAFT_3140353 [Mycena olivaceomarginata]|nr:hypothetical protein B0H14DRAFT_3140353 [Mycena olivaceomarginata]